MEEILETEIIAEKGFLYFCKRKEGKIVLMRSKAGRNKKEVKTEMCETTEEPKQEEKEEQKEPTAGELVEEEEKKQEEEKKTEEEKEEGK